MDMNMKYQKIDLVRQILAGMAILFLSALPAQAQFVPGPYYYQDMGVMGSVTSAYQSATQQKAYSDYRDMGAASAAARSGAWQNINRSMQSEAASRSATAVDAGQASRDWMAQNARSSQPARRPTTLPVSSLASVLIEDPARKTPKVESPKEIMLWPTLLKGKRFDADRAAVEAPFRRAYADKKPLTIEDYQSIIATVEKMKQTVKSMESQLVETEYDSVQKYLDDLIADAQKRIKARE
jgi:hypothetical protein